MLDGISAACASGALKSMSGVLSPNARFISESGSVNQLQRVRRPRAAGPGVGQAAPKVDHRATVAVDADRRPHVAIALEVIPEHVPDPFEARRHVTVD